MSRVGSAPGYTPPAPAGGETQSVDTTKQTNTTQGTNSTNNTNTTTAAPGGPAPAPGGPGPAPDPKKAAEVKAEHATGGVARQAQLNAAVPKVVTEQEVLKGAKDAGLNKTELKQIEDRFKGMNPADRKKELEWLNKNVNPSAMANRAYRTYLELDKLQSKNPTRITNDVVETLTRGVAEKRTDTSKGQEGVLGQRGALNSADALIKMDQDKYDRVVKTLGQAGQKDGKPVKGADPQAEKALILKAAGARKDFLTSPLKMDFGFLGKLDVADSATGDLERYAGAIRGRNRKDLIEKSTLLDLDNDAVAEACQQRFTTSCTPTSLQIARAEADPIYAMQMHGEAINSLDATKNIGTEQQTELTAGGGTAVTRTSGAAGGVGMWPEASLNNFVGAYTHKTYTKSAQMATANDRKAALGRIDDAIRKGDDVPIVVAWTGAGGGSHTMLITDMRGDINNRRYLVTDPFDGSTNWISRQSIINGNTTFIQSTASQGNLQFSYE